MIGFECKQKITYHGVKPDLTVNFPVLVGSILEASLLHTESTPFPMAWFASNHVGFLLTNWQVEVHKTPKWNDEITIQTWPTCFKGVLAERTFEVYDKDGTIMVYANSGWVFTDLIRRRPVRPGIEILKSYGEAAPSKLTKNFKFPNYGGFKNIHSRLFTATRRDVDTNSHVNNTAYLEWAMDAIPDEVYNHLNVVDMLTSYKRECVKGTEILAETLEDPSNKNVFVVLIKNHRQNDLLLCEMFFRFGTSR